MISISPCVKNGASTDKVIKQEILNNQFVQVQQQLKIRLALANTPIPIQALEKCHKNKTKTTIQLLELNRICTHQYPKCPKRMCRCLGSHFLKRAASGS